MTDDPRVHWSLANPFGIVIDADLDTWWSGRVLDVVELDGGDAGVLVASETGGAWFVDDVGDALPLSNDWTNPDLHCLAAGPDGPRHFFAGGAGGLIYETDASHSAPLLNWSPIQSPLPGATIATAGTPVPAFTVYDLAVMSNQRILLAATNTGLFWAKIPETPPWWCALAQLGPAKGARPPYQWTRADEEDIGQGGYFSIGLTLLTQSNQRVAEAALESIGVVAGGLSKGVFIGRWAAGKLTLTRPVVMWPGVGEITDVESRLTGGPTSVASCESFPRTVYAASAQASGRMQAFLSSTDGGQRWDLINGEVTLASGPQDVRTATGDQGLSDNCIAVDPTAPEVVAFGWQNGTFVSQDAGKSWILIDGSVHHVDIHVLRFKPPTPDGQRPLYVGSDGGLAQVDASSALGSKPVVARSDYNRRLTTMQFYSTWVTRQFYGTISVSPTGSGHVSAGVHDNGNITWLLQAITVPWIHLDEGDGGWNGIVADGGLVRNFLDTHSEPNSVARQASATSAGFVGRDVVPIVVPMPVDKSGVVSPEADVVREPRYRNGEGQLMFAVGSKKTEVYGLFQDGPEQTYHWERLGSAPSLGAGTVASFSGKTVMVEEGGGRIFAFDSKNGSAVDLPIVLPLPASGAKHYGGGVPRIVMLAEDTGFALLNNTNLSLNFVLRLDGLRWIVPLSLGLPMDAAFYGLDAFVRRDGTVVLFVATDDSVYLSEDAGEHWVKASAGLPRRAHCADLRVGVVNNVPCVIMGTFGRSLWRADLRRMDGG
jgi:hypothetical protein